MKIKIGDFDILESGTIVGNEHEPIDFFVNEDVDFIVRLEFVNDKNQTDPPHKKKAEKFGERGVKLIFTNYDYPTGVGNSAPLKIGRFKNRELFLNYRIYSLESAGKLVHYSWLLGKEVANG
jgi:hypothetical protein